ncbi:hypothetical protein EJ110_NYTH59867 [Nymphaea thermarum]|nr:hypothetical protein EJ110_NYTH59867 [Nymphaea thermarum]
MLVNNAGVNFNTGSDNSVEFAERVIETNYFGTKRVIESMVPLMRSAFNARIVNTSSRLGRLNGRRNSLVRRRQPGEFSGDPLLQRPPPPATSSILPLLITHLYSFLSPNKEVRSAFTFAPTSANAIVIDSAFSVGAPTPTDDPGAGAPPVRTRSVKQESDAVSHTPTEIVLFRLAPDSRLTQVSRSGTRVNLAPLPLLSVACVRLFHQQLPLHLATGVRGIISVRQHQVSSFPISSFPISSSSSFLASSSSLFVPSSSTLFVPSSLSLFFVPSSSSLFFIFFVPLLHLLRLSSSSSSSLLACMFGSYTRIKTHLLKLPNHGIRGCKSVSTEKAQELKRLQDHADAIHNKKKISIIVTNPKSSDRKRKTIETCFDSCGRAEIDKSLLRSRQSSEFSGDHLPPTTSSPATSSSPSSHRPSLFPLNHPIRRRIDMPYVKSSAVYVEQNCAVRVYYGWKSRLIWKSLKGDKIYS